MGLAGDGPTLSGWRALADHEGVLMLAAGSQTYWHVTEIMDRHDLSRSRRFTVANDAPRMLRSLAASYLETHRVVATQRRRSGNGASFARFTLEPLGVPGTQLILHALLISLVPVRLSLP
jgi:hypothetical protein